MDSCKAKYPMSSESSPESEESAGGKGGKGGKHHGHFSKVYQIIYPKDFKKNNHLIPKSVC